MYRYREQQNGNGDPMPRAQVLASGVAMPWALDAQRILAEEWSVAVDVWSVTSWNELARDGVAVDEWNFLHPGEQARTPYVTQTLQDVHGPVLAVSDFMRAVPDQIAQWVPGQWSSLGTDGFGFADTRPAARRFFHVDAQSVVVGVLQALAARGEVKPESVKEAFDRYRIDDPTAVRDVEQTGGDA
jgi:pyruvate dehydrogenase E1 component